ncbi:MAG TPA: molybdopterin biosynthesis protein [Nitrospirae bacterium]|nr:molybdopterin biosynthesis protein [Nitrospirota bacterium]
MKPSRRRIYQTNTPLQEAVGKWIEAVAHLVPKEGEIVPVPQSAGRVTAAAVHARISSPFFHSSAMDGYAVRFHETFGATETNPLRLRIDEEAIPVNTGEPLPQGFNAVVMVEDVSIDGPFIEITESVTPYQHVRTVGEDIVQTELILPENQRIRPVDIGAMLAGGHTEVSVRKKPVVTLIPTGSEVVEPGTTPLRPGNIIDFNSYMTGAMVNEWGGEYRRQDVVSDDKDLLKEKILDSLEDSDLVVVIAGSSAGTRDFTPDAVGELGNVIVHGVGIRPGKPVLLGIVEGRPVIGLPGYPVSAYITFELFAKPLVHHLLGIEPERPDTLKARLSRPAASSLGQEEFLRVKVGKVGRTYIATPAGRGAGALMTLQRADGIVRIPAMSEGIAQNTEVEVALLRSRDEIENTVVCIGSHDNTLDVLANILKKRTHSYSLSSAHVGSMGGMMAIKKMEAHIAGTHLLDEPTGEYNVPFIRRLLADVPLMLVNLVYRQQGLIVRRGNPKCIRGVRDLTRKGVVFINRQRGSGTRLLTDKCLRDNGIDPREIEGYEREEYTHMGVASAVATGVADAGMGILPAAAALGQEFIPVAKERYDLIIRGEYVETPKIQSLLDILRNDEEFRSLVTGLGGYDLSDMGEVVYSHPGTPRA